MFYLHFIFLKKHESLYKILVIPYRNYHICIYTMQHKYSYSVIENKYIIWIWTYAKLSVIGH